MTRHVLFRLFVIAAGAATLIGAAGQSAGAQGRCAARQPSPAAQGWHFLGGATNEIDWP
ncbi:hypothetical protein [Hamadaea tsunoensis]|uniref:hypothetical protein n=1 Tax=Hamadaea tsunoensis TaxID=53368 RepID=UPI000429CFDC|nr:hypothetical protein [Hamadaea tsunoensis]